MKYKILYQDNNKIVKKIIESDNLKSLQESIEYPNNIIDISEQKPLVEYFKIPKQITKKDIYQLFEQLNIMLNSNITINEAISLLLKNKQKKEIEQILINIENSIKTSSSIKESLQDYKKYLGDTTILFLSLGIENGNIKESIASLVEINNQDKKIITKFQDIFRYPLILLISLIISIIMIFIYVLPNFQYIFTMLGDNLPLATKILLDIKYIGKNYYYILAMLPILMVIIFNILYQKYRLTFDKCFILNIPLISRLFRSYIFYRLFLSIYIIVKSKYKFQTAINHSQIILKNSYLQQIMKDILIDIKSGISIANAFQNRMLFDDITIKLLHTAEYTNNYEVVLLDIVNVHKKYFENSIKKFSTFMEPTIILLISLVVLWMVLAVMVPMWDMSNVIS